MSRSNKEIINRNLYHIFWACLIGFVMWISYSTYQALGQKADVKVDSRTMSALSANLDETVLQKLAERRLISEDDVKMIVEELSEIKPKIEDVIVATSSTESTTDTTATE